MYARKMRNLLQKLILTCVAAIIAGSIAIPHICQNGNDVKIEVEHQLNDEHSAVQDLQDFSEIEGHCCIAHHCCFAKLINPNQIIGNVTLYVKADIFALAIVQFRSIDSDNLDRPPKYIA